MGGTRGRPSMSPWRRSMRISGEDPKRLGGDTTRSARARSHRRRATPRHLETAGGAQGTDAGSSLYFAKPLSIRRGLISRPGRSQRREGSQDIRGCQQALEAAYRGSVFFAVGASVIIEALSFLPPYQTVVWVREEGV